MPTLLLPNFGMLIKVLQRNLFFFFRVHHLNNWCEVVDKVPVTAQETKHTLCRRVGHHYVIVSAEVIAEGWVLTDPISHRRIAGYDECRVAR